MPITNIPITTTGRSKARKYGGGDCTVAMRGAFGGTTASLYWCDTDTQDNTKWFPVNKSDGTQVQFTSLGSINFRIGEGYLFMNLTSGSAIALELLFAPIGAPDEKP